MTDEWKVVSRGRRPQMRAAQTPHEGTIPYKTRTMIRKRRKSDATTENSRLDMKANCIFKIKAQLQKSPWWTQVERLLNDACKGRKVHSVHCLGIGSFFHSTNAMHQLACALLLKAFLIPDGVCSVTDPAMADIDLQLAHHLRLQVIPFNELDTIEPPSGFCTILFMPHCGLCLNEQMFAKCYEFKFRDVIFLANTFSIYVNTTEVTRRPIPFARLIQHLSASNAFQEQTCPDASLSTRETAFNDLAVTVIDLSVAGTQTQLPAFFERIKASREHN